MYEDKISNQEWIPYLIDDGVFQIEGIRAHIGQHDSNLLLLINVIDFFTFT